MTLYLESAAGPTASQRDVYALRDHPVATVTGSLTNPDNWCDVLRVAMGTKYDQTLENACPVEFTCSVTSSGTDYMEVVLDAPHGPFGTPGYRIALKERWPSRAGRRADSWSGAGVWHMRRGPTPTARPVAHRQAWLVMEYSRRRR